MLAFVQVKKVFIIENLYKVFKVLILNMIFAN